MSTFTTTQSTVRFTDTDGDVSFTATRPAVTFTAAYQSVTGSGGGASDLDDLTDVTITAAASGDILRHNGTAFVDTPGTDHFEAAGAVSTHNASSAAHADLRAVTDDLLALAPGVSVVANPATATVVATHAELIDSGGIDLDYWPDGSACGFFTRTGTTYMVAPGGDGIAGGDGVMLTEVVANDPTVNRATRKTISSGPVGATWLGAGGGVHDTGTNLYLITHVEETVNGYNWWYLGMSKSTDNGATWTYLYDLVTPNLTKATLAQNATIGNGALIEHDGYLYVFHASVNSAGEIIHLAVSRSTVASVEADADTWATWTGTAWTAGGDPADLMPATVTHVEQSGFDVIEVGDGWGLIYTDGLAGSAFLYTETLNDWSLSVPQFVHRRDNGEQLYRTYWSGNSAAPKQLTTTGTLFVQSSVAGGGSRWATNELLAYTLQAVDLKLPDTRISSRRTQTAYTYADGTVNLAGKTPGTVLLSAANQTVTMPPIADLTDPEYPHSYSAWTIYSGFANITITDGGDALPINFVGDLTLNAGDMAIMVPVVGFAWVGFVIPSRDGASLAALGNTVDVVSNVAQDRILGRTSSGSGDSEELTAASVRALLGVQPVITASAVKSAGIGADEWSLPPGYRTTGTATGATVTNGVVWYFPMLVEQTITITAAAVRCSILGASSLCRVGFATANASWQPDTFVTELPSTFDTTSTGVKSQTGLSITLTPGRYLIMSRTETANPQLVYYSNTTGPVAGTSTLSSGGSSYNSFNVTSSAAFSTMPAWTTLYASTTNPCWVYLRWT